jgi:hypothetical protein
MFLGHYFISYLESTSKDTDLRLLYFSLMCISGYSKSAVKKSSITMLKKKAVMVQLSR